MRATDQLFSTAYSFRRYLQKNLPAHLDDVPKADPLARLHLPEAKALPKAITAKWPAASTARLADPASVSELPINHRIVPAAGADAFGGGETAAVAAWRQFVVKKLSEYPEHRNEPEEDATSGLSPYLHFGHISSHQMFQELMSGEKWSAAKLAHRTDGSRSGWWGVRVPVEVVPDGIDPQAYLRDVLDRISTHPARRIEELLPDPARR